MNNAQKTAAVTGSSTGIGLSVARTFLGRGWNVVLNGRSHDKLERAARELGREDRTATVVGNIGDPVTGTELVRVAQARFGGIDVLVNNAGTFARKNSVAPGVVRTPLYGDVDVDQLGALALLSRVGEAAEIAEAVAYLAEAEFATGHILNLDGGYVSGRA